MLKRHEKAVTILLETLLNKNLKQSEFNNLKAKVKELENFNKNVSNRK